MPSGLGERLLSSFRRTTSVSSNLCKLGEGGTPTPPTAWPMSIIPPRSGGLSELSSPPSSSTTESEESNRGSCGSDAESEQLADSFDLSAPLDFEHSNKNDSRSNVGKVVRHEQRQIPRNSSLSKMFKPLHIEDTDEERLSIDGIFFVEDLEVPTQEAPPPIKVVEPPPEPEVEEPVSRRSRGTHRSRPQKIESADGQQHHTALSSKRSRDDLLDLSGSYGSPVYSFHSGGSTLNKRSKFNMIKGSSDPHDDWGQFVFLDASSTKSNGNHAP